MASNKTYDEIRVGDSAEINRRVDRSDLVVFAHASGNFNPVHLPEDQSYDPDKVAPSMWVGALFSAVLGNVLPGVGTLYRSQNLVFKARAHLGDVITIKVTAREKLANREVKFACSATLSDGEVVAEGHAVVVAPTQSLESEIKPPDLILHRHRKFDRLLAACRDAAPMATAVVCPGDKNSLGGVRLAVEEGLIVPVLLGDGDQIRKTADDLAFDISGFELVDTGCNDHKACRDAVAMIHSGRAVTLMKGNVHSDELLGQVTKRDGGLRTSRRLSHVFVMDVPGMEQLLFVSDAAINILPDLQTKVDITQNAITLANACGLAEPKCGILSAVETVNPKIPSTIDAAVLAKMADRGQIKGGIVDGPLAMDNAVNMEAARTKGIRSLVAGQADILIVPNLESGNMLAKELTFVARADAAGLVIGAQVPVILTSRSDNEMARLASTALAHLLNHYQQTGTSALEETGHG